MCWLVVAPLATVPPALFGGGDPVPTSIRWMLELNPMNGRGVFPGSPYPMVDGAMWTIAYEFRCYLMVLALGLIGAFRRRWIAPLLGLAALAAFELVPEAVLNRLVAPIPRHDLLLGWPVQSLRLTGVYLMGVSFLLFRDAIPLARAGMVTAAVLLIAGMFVQRLAEPALATAGAYLLFAVARRSRSGLLTRINNRDDISYGVYLYAWPANKLLLWFFPALPLLVVGAVTFVAACLCGWLSWHGLEKPIMRRLR